MDFILKLLKDYEPQYNRNTKILAINKAIEVSLFIYVKYLLYPYLQTGIVKDIRVETLEPLRNNYERRF